MTFDWNVNLADLIPVAIKIAGIIIITYILILVAKRLIPKIITARIPNIREESLDQLAIRSQTLSQVVIQAVSVSAWVIASVTIVGVLGINITPIVASVGIAGLAIGFAAQNIIRDYMNGFYIIMEDWYRVGEVANIAGVSGIVVTMNLRRTTLRDLSGNMHVIPNSKIEMATNKTRDWSRINMDVTVAYKEDLGHVINIINDVGREFKEDNTWGNYLLTAPEVMRVENLGDHGVDIKILADTKPMRQWALMGELRKRLKDRFDYEGIEIPWPHTKVYFGDEPWKEKLASSV